MVNQSDEELVALVKLGNILAFEEIVKRYEMKLVHYAQKRLLDEFMAQEVAQDVLIKIYRNIHRIDAEKKLGPYLFTIARNEVVTRLRTKKDTLPLLETVIGTTEDSLIEMTFKKDLARNIKKLISTLKEGHRKVLQLYFFEDLSYKKIQEKLKLPLSTVKTRLRRAKAALAKKIDYGKK